MNINWRKLFKTIEGMRPEEMEDFVLENAILISKTTENDKNVFIYMADESYFQVISSPASGRFEEIKPVDGDTLKNYLNKGEKRDLFFYRLSAN
jgi:hypothetical protein